VTVGFFSPLPPARSGVADYSAELLRALEGDPEVPVGAVKVNARDADIPLYHLGNNHLHREIYADAISKPGVAVLHDAVLHHFFLGGENEREYVSEFVYNYGHWSEDLARELWRRRSRSAADPEYFRYPMIKRVVERSQAVIVHNPRAAALVHEHVRGTTVHEIPHLFALPQGLPSPSEVIRWRARLGVAPHVFLVGVFGHLRESKRLLALLRAFRRARRSAEIVLLVAGDFVSSDLARSAQPLLLDDPAILRLGYLDEDEFWLCASAVDACINLRYPMAGETSGIAIRLMGLGKPVLVSSGEETSRFPEAACVRIDPGQAEEEMLAEYLVWLARCPGDARAIGQRAREHIRDQHAPGRVAQLYWQALQGCYHKAKSTVMATEPRP
jgi:glycosyltransferase involved in cell wall biosynthesis